jgi:hypothetical protein
MPWLFPSSCESFIFTSASCAEVPVTRTQNEIRPVSHTLTRSPQPPNLPQPTQSLLHQAPSPPLNLIGVVVVSTGTLVSSDTTITPEIVSWTVASDIVSRVTFPQL